MGYLITYILGMFLGMIAMSISTTPEEYAKAEELCAANGGIKKYTLAIWEPPAVLCNNDGKFRVKGDK